MATHVERSIEVEVPVRTAYDQWTQFEEFPRFMGGVQEVRQVGDALTHWVAEIAGVKREWDAAILEQVPDEKVAWAATTGATNAGAVYFKAVGDRCTQVRLTLDFEPEGVVERIADVFDVVDRQAVADLDRFKDFIEQQGAASGGWRGQVGDGEIRSGSEAGAAGGGADDVPGDVVAVGPTGNVHGTLDTEGTGSTDRTGGGASTPAAAYLDDEGRGAEEGGDPVAVDPERTGPVGSGAETGHTATAAGAGTFDDDAGRTDEFRVPVAEQETAGAPAVGRDLTDEGGGEVFQKDFADRDVVEEDVAKDFANRDITSQDVENKGVTGMAGAQSAATGAREGMEGDTGFQGTESDPDRRV